MDNKTAPQSNQFQIYISSDSIELLTFLNSYNNSIYFYDFENASFLYKRYFEKGGANGVGAISGYHIHSLDSIFLYNYKTSMLYLFDANQQMLDSYSLDKRQKYSPTIKVGTNSPLVIVGDTAYMVGNIAGEYEDETRDNRPVLAKLNLESKEIAYSISYPDIYRKANWGGGQYRWLSHQYNPVDSLLFFSFSVSHDLKFFDISSDTIFSKYMGSSYINEIPAISSTNLLNSISKESIRDQFILNGSYQYVGYVPSDKFYFRTVFLPENDYDPMEFKGLQSSVIIMNQNFEKVGEKVFPKRSYWTKNCLISCEGLWFQKLTNKENVIMFDKFKIQEIE